MKQKLFSVILLATCAALAACGVTREYKQPDIAFPEGYRGAKPAAKGVPPDSSVAMLPYKIFFSDPTLLQLIDNAIAHNIDLQTALKNIDYAKESLNTAKLGYFPTLNAQVLGTGNSTPPALIPGSTLIGNNSKIQTYQYQASGILSWEADIWGKIRSKHKSALANYLKTEEAAKAVRTQLVSDVASGYYNLLMLDTQLEISRKNLELANTTLKMIRLQYDAGQETILAIQSQEAVCQNTAASLLGYENSISAQENALSILCGSMPGEFKRDRALLEKKVADSLPSGIPSALLQNRPDVREAELALRAAHADMGTAKATLYPSLTISATGGLEAIKGSDWFTLPGALYSSVQGSVVQPIFQRGQLKAQYNQSRIVRDQAELSFKLTVLKAVSDVSNSLVQLDKVKEQEHFREQRSATLHKAVESAKLLYVAGMDTYLDVITAETNSLNADLDLANVRSQHLTAMSTLYHSLGGGWR
ncbi:MAG: efflux transporter outer membrane subunit [Chlorobiaceae bacterium]